MKAMLRHILRGTLLLAVGSTCAAMAAEPPPTVDAQGTVAIPALSVPFSSYASPEARAMFVRAMERERNAPPLDGPPEAIQAYYDRLNRARVTRLTQLYPVHIAARSFGGVPTQVVTPDAGVAARQQHGVLINLHAGGMLWGAGSGGLVESIPIASVAGITVITVDYRESPQHVFPAASEDVARVYRELLKEYPARNIGIYGCSSGGGLTGGAVAWFLRERLPVPGAIGVFCASLVDVGGDSLPMATVLNGAPPAEADFKLVDLPYFQGAKADDPLVFPANAPDLLAQFPPTLLISGTRDMALSSAVQTQRLLARAGVDAELHVWDGMWHGFFVDPDMPESTEAYAVIARFFDRRLGQ